MLVGSRQSINMHNPKLSPNLKQPSTLTSLNYPGYTPYPKSSTHANPVILLLAPRLPNPLNHIKSPKLKVLPPSTAHYPTQTQLKTLTISARELVTLALSLH